jgi:hypothetical protein
LPWNAFVVAINVVRPDRRFYRLRTAVGKIGVLQLARRHVSQNFGEHGAQRIEQILAVQRLTVELVNDGLYYFWMAMPDVVNAKAAETIDVFFSVYIHKGVRACVLPFHGGELSVFRNRLAVAEKAGIYVVAEVLDRLARYPLCLVFCNVGFGDQIENLARIGVDVFVLFLYLYVLLFALHGFAHLAVLLIGWISFQTSRLAEPAG